MIAGSTPTGDFWANDILWQLNVLAKTLSVMMRQKKSRFKKQEHHFYKADLEELDRLIEAA